MVHWPFHPTQYDVHKDPHRNIALPDSLLSRFDLLFVVTDDVDEQRDRMISEHVLRMHRYLQPGLEEGTPAMDNLDQALDMGAPEGRDADGAAMTGDTNPFEKFDPLLHGGIANAASSSKTAKKEVLSIAFIKKYIQYAKGRPAPVLTKGASEWIVNVYAGLRNDELAGNQKKTSPLTPRTLETLIRLATAHAKARLSKKVEERDAEAAEEILRFALFKEVLKHSRSNKRRKTFRGSKSPDSDEDSEDEERDEEDEEERQIQEAKRMSMASPYRGSGRYGTRGAGAAGAAASPAPSGGQEVFDPDGDQRMDEDEDEMAAMRDQEDIAARPSGSGNGLLPPVEPVAPVVAEGAVDDARGISEPRLALFRSRVAELLHGRFQEEEYIALDTLLPAINEGQPMDTLFGTVEAKVALARMSDSSEVLFSDGELWRANTHIVSWFCVLFR